jgi:hypothetical protein
METGRFAEAVENDLFSGLDRSVILRLLKKGVENVKINTIKRVKI